MRHLIDIAEAFGSAQLSRMTDPEERVRFPIFCAPAAITAVQTILDDFPRVHVEDVVQPTSLLGRATIPVYARRIDAEGIIRKIKMARIAGVTPGEVQPDV